MRAIGFRADRTTVHWFAVEGTPEEAVSLGSDKIRLQAGSAEAEAFPILRTQILSLFTQFQPDIVMVRAPERPQGLSNIAGIFARARIEGVILEAAGSQNIKAIAALSQTIKSGMGTKTPVRSYVASDQLRGIDLSDKKNALLREAAIVAISGLGK